MTHISGKCGQFRYFDIQLRYPEWRGRKVLDFGGNVGNILRDPACAIEEEDYWCIDVVPEALAQGRRDFAKAHWLFYDCYNYAFNPTGEKGRRLPRTGQTFDYILAYSVFTHIVPSEMQRLLDGLLSLLADDGVLAFSFIDPFLHPWPGEYRGDNFRWRLDWINRNEMKVDLERAARIVKGAPWFVLADDAHVWVATERFRTPMDRLARAFHVYHTPSYIRALYPQAEILPPANRETQHCCVIRKNGFAP